MGENMSHELIPKGTMILDESNLAKSPDSKSMESIVQNILPNHYFNPILTFIHNTQQKRMFSNLIYFQICFFFFGKCCHTFEESESTRWGMLVTSWNSKATPDVPHPMSGHDFYSKLSTGLGGISPWKRWVFLWKNHGGSFLCWVDVLKNDAEVAVVGFCWEDVILMKLQFSRPGGRTLKFGYPILFLEAYEHPWVDTFKFSFFAFKKSKFQCLNKMAKVIVLIASKEIK